MKIIFKEAVAGVDFVYMQGEIVDMPAADAKQWINAGIAEKVVRSTKVNKPNVQAENRRDKRAVDADNRKGIS